MIHWRRKQQTTSVFLPGEPHGQYEKARRIYTQNEPPRLEGVQYATGEEQGAITNSSSKNEVAGPKQKWQLWMCLVVKVKSYAVKNNIA